MKINSATLLEIANAFAADMQHRFDLPELSNPQFQNIKVDGGLCYEAKNIPVRPKGQIALMVESMLVTVQVFASSGGDKVIYGGEVRYSYRHVGGGSNGYNVRFVIAVRPDILHDRTEYAGAVEWNLAHAIRTGQR